MTDLTRSTRKMMTMSSNRVPAMRSHAVQAREILAAGALPEPLKARLEVDLRDAIRQGFHVDLDQLKLALARFSG